MKYYSSPLLRLLPRWTAPLLLALAGGAGGVRAQTPSGVGIGTTTPHSSAALEVRSTSQGLLPPRLTTVQRDALASPAAGLVIYNTDRQKLNVWNGTAWTEALATAETAATVRFNYTGAPQTWTVPAGVTTLRVDLAGAQGGADNALVAQGGRGGRVTGVLSVVPGQQLTVYVGGQGAYEVGGYNGGGWGGPNVGYGPSIGGGGATDIRLGGTALTNRVLVAGGGGGAGERYFGQGNPVGGGGGYNGQGGGGPTGGTGAWQTAGGNYGGALGQGGGYRGSPGGGGGYYGGGAAQSSLGGGGGGSSYADPTLTQGVQHTTGQQAGDGYATLTPLAAPTLSLANADVGQSEGALLFSRQGKLAGNASQLFWDAANERLGVGTGSPAQKLEVNGGLQISGSGNGLTFPDGSLLTTAAPQVLSVTLPNTLSLSGGGGSVSLPPDNLGNHSATQPLALNDQPLRLRAANDGNHQLSYSGSVNGAQLTGYDGGELGANAGAYLPVLRWNGSGKVGIGTSAPQAKLDVQGTGSIGGYSYAYYSRNGIFAAYGGNGSNSNDDVSIRATGRVVGAEFNATSDRRLKHVIGLSSGAADLALLRQLRITDYTMRDRAQYGARRFKKVIAQEVETVFPQAVSQHVGFLPDLYAPVTATAAEGDSLLHLTLAATPAATAAAGQRVRLIGPGGEVLATVARPAVGRQLVVRGARHLLGQELFAFGLEHADVRTVDYEALAMLNVSATQELARRVAELEAQNAALNAQRVADQAQTTASLQALADRLRTLEAGQAQAHN